MLRLKALLMADSEQYRKELGQRIKAQRKGRDWTQKELAQKIDITFGQLNKYESGLNSPSPELLVRIAHALTISLDYMLTGYQADNLPILDTSLLERFIIIQQFRSDDRATVIKLIDAMVIKHRAEGLLQPVTG